MEEKNTNYIRQVIVVRKDLNMPAGKLAAMVAHACMTFLLETLPWSGSPPPWKTKELTEEQWRWLTELDPGLEHQVSMAKIVCAVKDEAELLDVERQAEGAKLEVHRVVDCGYSHNKPNTLVAVAIGPDYPEKLAPVTGGLKVYR